MYQKIVTAVRLLMGVDYMINGINWWFKMITPYPSISDFVNNPPPPDMVGAMIQTGFMFHLVKAAEVLTGLALLSNRFVPLMLVAVFPVTISVFLVDVVFVATVRGYVMGIGAFAMNSFLILAYFSHYRGMMNPVAQADQLHRRDFLSPTLAPTGWERSDLRAAVMPLLGVVALIFGVAMVVWVAVMMVQYQQNPLPLMAH